MSHAVEVRSFRPQRCLLRQEATDHPSVSREAKFDVSKMKPTLKAEVQHSSAQGSPSTIDSLREERHGEPSFGKSLLEAKALEQGVGLFGDVLCGRMRTALAIEWEKGDPSVEHAP